MNIQAISKLSNRFWYIFQKYYLMIQFHLFFQRVFFQVVSNPLYNDTFTLET